MSETSVTTLFEDYCAAEAAILKSNNPSEFPDPAARTEYTREVLKMLQQLDRRIEASDLFSPNEIADDIPTGNLKYLLVAFMLGDYLLCMPSTIDDRSSYVHDAELALKRFLDRLDLYLLVTEEAKKDWMNQAPKDPVSQRQRKIMKFKRDKLLKQQMETLVEARNKMLKANAIQGQVDEDSVAENERDIVLLMIESSIDKAIEHLHSIDMEKKVLAHHKEEQHMKKMAGIPLDTPPSQTSLPGLTKPGEDAQPQRAHTHNHSGQVHSSQFNGPDVSAMLAQQAASKQIKVHSINSHDDVKAPIPSHMAQFMQKLPQTETKSTQAQEQPAMTRPPNSESDAERLHKSWFNPSVQKHCPDCALLDEEAIAKLKNNRITNGIGKLAPNCPIHGNAHPPGQCPGPGGGSNALLRDLNGFNAMVDKYVNLRSDRHAVFRDRNPCLIELDDWVRLKQSEGGLPSERDIQLQNKMTKRYEEHMQRIEDGLSDDEEQMRTQAEEEEEEERAQLKARAWADYTDDHQKGAGNKNYRK